MQRTLFWEYSKRDIWLAIRLKLGEFEVQSLQQYENMILAIGKVFAGKDKGAKPQNFRDAQSQLKKLMGG